MSDVSEDGMPGIVGVILGIIALAIIITLASMVAIGALLASPLALIAWLFSRRNPLDAQAKLVLCFGTMVISETVYVFVNPWLALVGLVVFGGGTAIWYFNHPWFEAKKKHDTAKAEFSKITRCPPSLFAKLVHKTYYDSEEPIDPSWHRFTDTVIATTVCFYEGDYTPIELPEFPSFDLRYNKLEFSMVAQEVSEAISQAKSEMNRAGLTIDLVRGVVKIPFGFYNSMSAEGPFSAPLYEFVPDVGAMVNAMLLAPFDDEYVEAGVGRALREIINDNITEAGRVMPPAYDGRPEELIHSYLKNTTFEGLFYDLTPAIVFDERLRAAHGVIVAGSDGGKSQTLENLILADLDMDDPPGMVVIDSKAGPTDLLQRIARLDVFHPDHGRLRDRLVIIDPRERPSLNMFDVDIDGLDDQAVNDTIDSLEYFLGSLLGSDITGKQSVIFVPMVELMCHVPGATLDTFVEALNDLTPFMKWVRELPKEPRDFLLSDDFSRPRGHYTETKNELKRRLQQIIQRRTVSRMFNAGANALNIARALNEGKIILISAERTLLKGDLSSMFARYFISRVKNAALDRGRLVEKVKPARIYIDECAPYVDEQLEELLTTLRSYGLGAMLAFQDVQQMGSFVHTVRSNTAIKMMSTVSASDARAFAEDMRISPEFIMSQVKPPGDWPEFGVFACYTRGMPRAVSVRVPFGALDKRPLMNDRDYARMRMFNRAAMTKDTAVQDQDGFEGTTIDGDAEELPGYERGLPQPKSGTADALDSEEPTQANGSALARHYEALEQWTDIEMLATALGAVNDLGNVTLGRLAERLNPEQLRIYGIARDQRNDLVHHKVPFPDLARWKREVRLLHQILARGENLDPDDDTKPGPSFFK